MQESSHDLPVGEPALESQKVDLIPSVGSSHHDTGPLDPGKRQGKDKQKDAFPPCCTGPGIL